MGRCKCVESLRGAVANCIGSAPQSVGCSKRIETHVQSSLPPSNLAVRALRGLAALVVGCGVLLAATTVGDHQLAGAASPTGTVTYTDTGSSPIPLPSKFAGPSQGDGWALVFSNTQAFNVFHHQAGLQIDCHQLSDASECWSAPKTVTDGSVNFATSIAPGMVLNSSNGHLYV